MSTQINPASISFQIPGLMAVAQAMEELKGKALNDMPEHALALLNVLPRWPDAITRVEIAKATGLSESRVHAAMQVLREHGYIKGTPKTGNTKSTYWRAK